MFGIKPSETLKVTSLWLNETVVNFFCVTYELIREIIQSVSHTLLYKSFEGQNYFGMMHDNYG